MGPGEDGDGVELDRAETAQHAADPAPAVGGAEEALGAQEDAAGFVGGQFGDGTRKTRHGHTVRPGTDNVA